MDKDAIRVLIRAKLTDGRLPKNSIPRVWGGPGNGESCDACEQIITKNQFLMEGLASGGDGGVQLHVMCFYVWEEERRAS